MNISSRDTGGVVRVNMNSDYQGVSPDGQSWTTTQDLADAMRRRDEFGRVMYETNPRYRAAVQAALEASEIAKASTHQPVRVQRGAQSTNTYVEPTEKLGESERDKASIARFEASQRAGRS